MLQFFSSVGGVPILFDKFGNRTDEPEIRNKPNFLGPDSVLATFYTKGPMGLYYGTPCNSGHVAGVAALMSQLNGGPKSLKPQDICGILERTAIDMNDNSTVDFDSGFDFSTGYGFVNASAALDVTASITAPTRPDDESPTSGSHKCISFRYRVLLLFCCGFLEQALPAMKKMLEQCKLCMFYLEFIKIQECFIKQLIDNTGGLPLHRAIISFLLDSSSCAKDCKSYTVLSASITLGQSMNLDCSAS